jgi:phage head maturation protease
MPDNLRSYGTVRAEDADESTRRVTAIISTEEVARDGAVIHQDGWDFTHFDRNPVVLFSHDDGSPPIARVVEHRVEGAKLIAVSEFDGEDEGALRLFSKIKRGFINATSVRWNPLTWEFREAESDDDDDRGKRHDQKPQVLHFLTQELLEFSFVSIPADPNALIVRADGADLNVADYLQVGDLPPDGNNTTITTNGTSGDYDEPPTRETLLDDMDYLRSCIEQYGAEALAGRLNDQDRGLVLALQQQLDGVTAVKREPARGANTTPDEVARELGDLLATLRDAPKPEQVLIAVLAKKTGRSEDAIREEIRSI